jgi:tetratricopeptide (TPR) repeat protein
MDENLKNLLTLAKGHYAHHDFVQARACLEQITEQHQGFADVYNMLGVVYHDGGLFTKAQSALERALQLNPKYTEAGLNLAVLYNDLGRYSEARSTYGQALALCREEKQGFDPFVAGKIANMHAEVADAYRQAGRLQQAIGEYQKALELRPTFADIRTHLATALMENRQHTLAAQELQRALLDRPEYLTARLQLGVCFYSMGKLEEAMQQWTQVTQQDPNNASAAMYTRMVHADRDRSLNARDNA